MTLLRGCMATITIIILRKTDGVLNISTGRPDCGGIDSSASGSRLISITANGQVSTQMYSL